MEVVCRQPSIGSKYLLTQLELGLVTVATSSIDSETREIIVSSETKTGSFSSGKSLVSSNCKDNLAWSGTTSFYPVLTL